jgi:hypothetical protein
MRYMLFNSTDGLEADLRTFPSIPAAMKAREDFKSRFKIQGYYKTSDGRRIPVEDVELEIIPASQRDQEDYD